MTRQDIGAYSAYAIAVENGFDGTKEEWLASLNGKSAYETAVEGGYTKDESTFAAKLATSVPHYGNAVFFGDSLSAGSSNDDYSYVDILSESDYFESVTKIAVASTTFGPYSVEGVDDYCFVNQVQNASYASAITNADIIYFEYGANDVVALCAGKITAGTSYDDSGTETLCGYMKQALDYILSLNPDVTLVFLDTLDTTAMTGSYIQTYLMVFQYLYSISFSEAIRHFQQMKTGIYDICNTYSIKCLSLTDAWALNTANSSYYMASDNAHPSTAGHERLAESIIWQSNSASQRAFRGNETYIISGNSTEFNSGNDATKLLYKQIYDKYTLGYLVVLHFTDYGMYVPVSFVNSAYAEFFMTYEDDATANTISTLRILFYADGTASMDTVSSTTAFSELEDVPANHRNFYRGKYLGDSVTEAQQAAITAGTFDDLFVGDYWTIGGVNWRIADINYYRNVGDTALTTNHLVIVPDTRLYAAAMNSSATTAGGYVGCDMYTANLDTAKETIASAFGDLVLTHREYLVNAATSGVPSAAAWYDSTVELMTEKQVYGCNICGAMSTGSTVATKATSSKHQLALFRLNPEMINTAQTYWLQDVASAYNYAYVATTGVGHNGACTITYGVRPYFLVGC